MIPGKLSPVRTAKRKTKRSRWQRSPWLLPVAGLSVILLAIPLLFFVADRNASRMEGEYTEIPSPNFDKRPLLASINCVVLHATVAETADDTIVIFCNPRSKVSAHFVVARDGKIMQMVPLGRRAWHAGVSRLESKRNVNNFSVGIEMVNRNDGLQPYTEYQYQAVAQIIRHLRTVRGYDIPDKRIVSHHNVAVPPGRKSDPRGFDFAHLYRLLANH